MSAQAHSECSRLQTAETTFASNIDDLLAASNFLASEYQAPELLIGHSLGGAGAIHAAAQIPSLKAVATIGAPYDPEHVTRLIADDLETIREQGEATVNIGGRPFTIRREFLETLQRENLSETVHSMRRALLVMHSPDRLHCWCRKCRESISGRPAPEEFRFSRQRGSSVTAFARCEICRQDDWRLGSEICWSVITEDIKV